MRGCNARPVKDALGDPVVACRVALGIFPCRNLRHVYNDAEPRPFASVGKVSRCLDESGAHGIAKVGGARTRCSADRIVMRASISRGSSRLAVLLLRLWLRPEFRIPTAE